MDGMQDIGREAGVPIQAASFGGLMGFHFNAKPVRNYTDALADDVPAFVRFFRGMLAEGVYLAPSAFEAGFMSLAHTDADIDQTLTAARKVLKKGERPGPREPRGRARIVGLSSPAARDPRSRFGITTLAGPCRWGRTTEGPRFCGGTDSGRVDLVAGSTGAQTNGGHPAQKAKVSELLREGRNADAEKLACVGRTRI